MVRRDISSQSGRSRAFLNGALVTSGARDAAAQLVDLHGQHEHQVLLDPPSHLDLLDAFAGFVAERERVGEAFARCQSLTAERDRLAIDLREKARREEYLQFQLTEIGVPPRSRAKTRSCRPAGRCSPTPNGFSGSAARPTPSSMKETVRRCLPRGGLEAGRRAGVDRSAVSAVLSGA